MRLDHLLSKEKSKGCINVLVSKRVRGFLNESDGCLHPVGRMKKDAQERDKEISGGDALMGHTRSHPEHDG